MSTLAASNVPSQEEASRLRLELERCRAALETEKDARQRLEAILKEAGATERRQLARTIHTTVAQSLTAVYFVVRFTELKLRRGNSVGRREITELFGMIQMGCMRAGGNRTVEPTVANCAMLPTNSKNCVARTMVNGMLEALIKFSWATFARKYPLVRSRSVPTTDSAT